MRVLEIIESKCWRNKSTGQTVSIYGATPWTLESQKGNWELHTRGYTWRMSNGTIGLCRQPAKTYEEAVEVMERINNK